MSINRKPFLMNRINNDFFVSSTAVIAGISTALGRFLFGYLYDNYPIISLLKVCLIINILTGFLFYFFAFTEFLIVFFDIFYNISGI
jgi:predicted MFS family arabinose efflux permease